jgi:hypothetical protein
MEMSHRFQLFRLDDKPKAASELARDGGGEISEGEIRETLPTQGFAETVNSLPVGHVVVTRIVQRLLQAIGQIQNEKRA